MVRETDNREPVVCNVEKRSSICLTLASSSLVNLGNKAGEKLQADRILASLWSSVYSCYSWMREYQVFW